MDPFSDVQPFLEGNTSVSPATRGKLLAILQTPRTEAHLMVELAVTIDGGTPSVKAAYKLEGVGH